MEQTQFYNYVFSPNPNLHRQGYKKLIKTCCFNIYTSYASSWGVNIGNFIVLVNELKN